MPDLRALIAAATAALIGRSIDPGERVGIALSGGADSMALADLAADIWPGQVAAATVDHGLRADSSAEAAMVATWCAGRGLPHAILTLDQPITGSLQAEARAARYALLDRWADAEGIDWLLTAHHADDQLETMLMRLNRASGLAGMAGVRGRRGRVLRPLLGVRKRDLLAYAEARALPFVSDPSNADARFDRARLRAHLANAGWLDAASAARTAAALAEAEEALAWAVDAIAAEHVVEEGDACRLLQTDFPREILRRLLLRMLVAVAPDGPSPRGEQIDEALVQLCHGRKLSLGACTVTGGPRWTVVRAPPRRTG